MLRKIWLSLLTSLSVGLDHSPSDPTGDDRSASIGATSRPNHPQSLSSADWSSLRAAYESGRHAAFAVNGGYEARNPGQGWLTHFDGRGFTTAPDGGGRNWGLQLEGYGAPERERAVGESAEVKVEGSRIVYMWDSNLTEWYVNDTRGLEHGFTIHSRPAHVDGILSLTLSIRGDLLPRIDVNGRGIGFVDRADRTVLTYSGLEVIDADGLQLDARFALTNCGLQLSVNDVGARYPLTIDPIAQQAYLKASNPDSNDMFGSSVAVSGNTVVIGAPSEASNATGVNGDQSNNSFILAGAAYVFVRNGATWSQQAYLKASNTDSVDQFGGSVAVSGDTIVVGAILEASSAAGVNGNQADNSASGTGAAYVFVRNGTTWSQEAYLKASNPAPLDFFGHSVAISGETILVGAIGEASNATGVNGDESNNTSSGAGAVYVFTRSGSNWSQQAYVKASNTNPGDQFGRSVAISGDTMVVGASQEDSNATGVNGNQSDNSFGSAGAAYVFTRSGSSWSQQAYLKASNTDHLDAFGGSVAVSGDTVVVGAQGEDSNATGVNGDQSNEGGGGAGAAYIFVRNGANWSQQAYVKASNTGLNDRFAASVGVSGDTVVIGADGEDSNATGVNGDQSNNSSTDAGAVYVFTRSGATWSQKAYVKASNTGTTDVFGMGVAVSGDTLVVGAKQEDSNASGVNGIQSDNSLVTSGAAYVFDLDTDPGTSSYGTGTPGCSGTHTLGVNHAPMVGSPSFKITCDNAPPSSLGLALVTDAQDLTGSDPFAIGVLMHVNFFAATEILSFNFVSDGSGIGLTVNTAIPNSPALIGKTYYAMALWVWSSCSLPPFNFSTSRGLAITIQAP